MSINLLKKFVSKDQYKDLRDKVELHLRFSSIDFEILQINDEFIQIRTTQDKSFAGVYFTGKRLHEITIETFKESLLPRQIRVNTFPFLLSPCDKITPKLVMSIMGTFKIKNKEFETAFGVHKTTISAWANGLRPMSQPVKAMFYYYFISKGYIHE